MGSLPTKRKDITFIVLIDDGIIAISKQIPSALMDVNAYFEKTGNGKQWRIEAWDEFNSRRVCMMSVDMVSEEALKHGAPANLRHARDFENLIDGEIQEALLY